MNRLLLIPLIVIIFSTCILAQTNDTNNTKKAPSNELEEIINQIEKIQTEREYLIKNYEIQNNTIQTVSAILGILLAVVVIYFGWRAQRVDNEYERVKRDRDKFEDQFDKILSDMNVKLKLVNDAQQDIINIKEKIITQTENINMVIENMVLALTEEYLEKNKDNLFNQEGLSQFSEISNKVESITSQLKILEDLQQETNPDVIYKKIDILHKSDRYNDVITLVKLLIDKPEFKKDYYFQYAYALFRKGQNEEAKKYYRLLLEHRKDSSGAMNNLAVIMIQEKDFENAKPLLEEAIKLKKDFIFIKNLVSCYSIISDKYDILKKYYSTFETNDMFMKFYKEFIWNNYFNEDIYLYYKKDFEKENTPINYLNYLESLILTRNCSEYDTIIHDEGKYNFNLPQRLILNFLKMFENGLRDKDLSSEKTNIDVMISNEDIKITWDFIGLKRLVTHVNNDVKRETIFNYLNKLEEIKQKSK